MKRILLSSICFLLLFGCKKNDSPDTTPQPPPVATSLSLSSGEALPGDAVQIKVNKKQLAAEVNISLGSSTVKGYVQGDSAYMFLVPVIAPGSLTLSIPSLAGANSVSLTIKNYSAITDPQGVITDYLTKRNAVFDSLAKTQSISGFQPSPETITFLGQLKDELDQQLSKLSASEKELVAYSMLRNMPDPASLSLDLLTAENYARENGIKGDIGDQLVATAKGYVVAHVGCVATVPVLVGTGAVFLLAPNPLTATAFLVSFTAFVITKETAERRAREVGKLKGVAEAISGADAQKIQSADFYNNQERAINMSVDFRNLAATDAGINNDIASAFNAEQTLINKDKEVGDYYNSIKAKVASLFTKLTAVYPAYSATIGKIAQAKMTKGIDGNQIIVKSVSDPRINYTSTLSNNIRKVAISSTATTEISFNLKVAYVRTLDNKEITKDIACTFKPTPDSTDLYRASVLGKFKVNNYKGNGPATELYCEVQAGGQAIYTIYNDPSWTDGTKFYASWAIAKANGRYYYSENGFWHYAFPSIEEAYPLTYPVSSFQYHNSTVYSK